jgi:putative MFS transporter
MFILNLIVFVVGSVLQFFITDATQLIILRFIMGVAVGRVVAIETTLRPY